jgi:cell division septum initiation protein DivIVA
VNFEQAIQELQAFYGESTRVPGLRKKVMVDGDRFSALIDALKSSVPAEIQEAREVLTQKDSILNQAYLESQRMKSAGEEEVAARVEAAHAEHMAKVDESEIVAAANARAQEITDEAMEEAQAIVQDAQKKAYGSVSTADQVAVSRREGADQYAREVLFSLEEQLSEMLGQIRRGIDILPVQSENHTSEVKVPA